jgi:hypothetical protein
VNNGQLADAHGLTPKPESKFDVLEIGDKFPCIGHACMHATIPGKY